MKDDSDRTNVPWYHVGAPHLLNDKPQQQRTYTVVLFSAFTLIFAVAAVFFFVQGQPVVGVVFAVVAVLVAIVLSVPTLRRTNFQSDYSEYRNRQQQDER